MTISFSFPLVSAFRFVRSLFATLRRPRLAVTTGLLAPTLVTSVLSAAIWRVDPNSPTNGDGSLGDWSNASHTLSAVLANTAVLAGDSIRVANGVFKPATQASSFVLISGVQVLGGYAGYGATDPNARNLDAATNGCVLSGDISGNDGANFANYGDNCYHVVRGASLTDATLLESFTIRGGSAFNTLDFNGGGGVFLSASVITMRHCRVIENQGEFQGGGVYFKGGNSGTAVFKDCYFANNRAELGGAIHITPKINISRSRFENNTGTGSNGSGGAIYNGCNDVVNIYNCEIIDNSAVVGAGITSVDSSSALLRVVNCVIAENTGTLGGGIYLGGTGHLDVGNTTISANSASGDGGGIYFNNSAGSSSITNSIVYGNASTSGEDEIQDSGITLTITYSDILGGWTGTGNINSDPDFVGGGDYSLQCGSPCINAGDDESIADDEVDLDDDNDFGEYAPFDLLLNDRIIGADPFDSDDVDMGAIEKPYEACLADTDNDGDVDVTDLLNVVTNWGTCVNDPCVGDVAPGGPCATNNDEVVDTLDLNAVIASWGDCSESFSSGGASLEDCLECLQEAENLSLSDEDWIDFMIDCLLGGA